MTKKQKAFIFDIDGTITDEDGNDLSHERIIKLLDLIIENGWLIFIVTARPIQLEQNEIRDIDLYEEEYGIFTSRVDDEISSKIHEYKKEETGCKKLSDLYKLNRNSKKRWLYYMCHVDYIPGIANEICIIKEMNNEIPNLYKFDSDEGKNLSKTYGGTKMNQIIEIKENFNIEWNNIYFFDDAPHNFYSWCDYKEVCKGMAKMNYIHNNNHTCNNRNYVRGEGREHVFTGKENKEYDDLMKKLGVKKK